jgi:flagellar motility protein MotE (MotC chaperone)
MPSQRQIVKHIAERKTYHSEHPKGCYNTAKEAAKALRVTEKHNQESQNNYSRGNSKMHVYYNGDLSCYQIGHGSKGSSWDP